MKAKTAQAIADMANGVEPRISAEFQQALVEAAASGKYSIAPHEELDLSAIRWLENHGYQLVYVDALVSCMKPTIARIDW